jgi:streptomycin 6-kinase
MTARSDALARYLADWGVTDPALLCATPVAAVYIVTDACGTRRALKVLTPLGAADEGPGALALIHWAGEGAARVVRHDAGALLMEYAGDEALTILPDEAATPVLAAVARRLHAPRGPVPAGLTPLDQRFAALLDSRDFPEGRRVAEALLRSARPESLRVLHGDLHHGNILRGRRGWLAIDPKGLFGDRHYDLANAFLNPTVEVAARPGRAEALADHMARALGLDRPRLARFAFAHACLSLVWHAQDGTDPAAPLGTLPLLARLAGVG